MRSRDNSHEKPLRTVQCYTNMSAFLLLCNFLGACLVFRVDCKPGADRDLSITLLMPTEPDMPQPQQEALLSCLLGD